jgi:tetratricopeptide (TPR) repeat protein
MMKSMAMLCVTLIVTALSGFGKSDADYNYVFKNQRILTLTIKMTDAAYQAMQPKAKAQDFSKISSSTMFAREFPYAEAVVTCDGAVYSGVGVRYRGNASITMIPPDGKKPLKLDFNRFNKGQTFHGFTKLNLINCFRDPSMLRDKLTYDLYQKINVPAPAASFANLYLHIEGQEKQFLGLYVAVEQVNRPFLQNHFDNADGLLLKMELIKDLEYRGENWEDYAHDHELKSGTEKDTEHFIKFVRFLTEADDEKFAKQIEKKFNVDRFLAWLAMNTLLTDLDSYAGLGHNWYLYYDTDQEYFTFIPWDVNEAFGNLQLASPEDMLNFDIHQPYLDDRILIRRILAFGKYRAVYEYYLKLYIREHFNATVMAREIDQLYTHIKDAVNADANPIYTFADFQQSLTGPVTPNAPFFSQEIIGLNPFVAKRSESVLAQLAGERQGSHIQNMLFGMDRRQSPGRNPNSPADAPPAMMGAGPGEPLLFPEQKPITPEVQQEINVLKSELQDIKNALKDDSDNIDLLLQKSELLGRLTEMSPLMEKMQYGMEISQTFDRILELDANNIGGRIGRGAVRLFTPEAFGGNVDEAIRDFEFVLQTVPDEPQPNFYMGMAYQRKGENEKAVQHLKKALEADPQHAEAKKLLEQISQ